MLKSSHGTHLPAPLTAAAVVSVETDHLARFSTKDSPDRELPARLRSPGEVPVEPELSAKITEHIFAYVNCLAN